MSNENCPPVKRLKKQYPSVAGEFIYGERALQLVREEINKPRGIRAWEFQQKVKRKVEWLKKYDPYSVDIYLENPY